MGQKPARFEFDYIDGCCPPVPEVVRIFLVLKCNAEGTPPVRLSITHKFDELGLALLLWMNRL